jgi:hypothetical protein
MLYLFLIFPLAIYEGKTRFADHRSLSAGKVISGPHQKRQPAKK